MSKYLIFWNTACLLTQWQRTALLLNVKFARQKYTFFSIRTYYFYTIFL